MNAIYLILVITIGMIIGNIIYKIFIEPLIK